MQTNQKRVQSARASRELQEKKLEAEEKKLAAGMSHELLRLPGAARSRRRRARTEIQAISDYNKSLVDFEAVQQVPLSGGGGGITAAGSGSAHRPAGQLRGAAVAAAELVEVATSA